MAIKNKKIICGLTLTLIIGSLSYSIYKVLDEKKELENTITKLENNIDEMNTNIDKLNKKIEEKDDYLKFLNKELNVALKKYEEVKKQNNVLKSENDKFKKTKNASLNYNISDYEKSLLEKLVYCEARGESQEGQIAVVNVVLNRLNSDEFPDTITEIVYQKGQFSPAGNGAINYATPTQEIKESVNKALNGIKMVSDDTVYFYARYLDDSHAIRSHVQVTKTIGVHNFGK